MTLSAWRLMTLVAGALVAAALTSAQTGDVLARRLDAIAGAGVLENRSVGLVVALARSNQRVFVKPYGKASIDDGSAMTADTVLPIGSVTKTFTAAAVLQLRDQGKLGIDDDVTKWLPDFNAYGNKVTIRHLLGHTSGIMELLQMPELRALRMMVNPAVTREDMYRIVTQYPFYFPTGAIQVYSNTNYWLLGFIVEKASGMTYKDYIEERIFAPLGMTRSMYCNSAESVPRRAVGHGTKNGVARRTPDILHTATFSAGAICSSAEDMITFLLALHGGKVLSPKSYAEMIAPSRLGDGTALRYAMGLTIATDSNGFQRIGHDGGGFGFSSQAWWYPDAGLALVVLTNSEPDDTTAVAAKLAAATFEAFKVPGPAAPRAFTGDVAPLVGRYSGLGHIPEMVVDVTQTSDGLAASVNGAAATPIEWIEGWSFRRAAVMLTFRRDGSTGAASELRFDTGGDHFILKRR